MSLQIKKLAVQSATRLDTVIGLVARAFVCLVLGVPAASADDGASLLQKAQALLKIEQAPQATDIILAAIEKCPHKAQAYNLLGISYDEQSRYAKAEAAYRKAILTRHPQSGGYSRIAESGGRDSALGFSLALV